MYITTRVVSARRPENKMDRRKDLHYQRLRKIYREKGWFYAFYTFYRTFTCPIHTIFDIIPGNRDTMIDVGCGYGFISLWAALAFPNCRVLGIDVNQNRIQFARTISGDIPNLSFEVKDITVDEVKTSDVILLIDLFHHIPFDKHFHFLDQCINKVPPGGAIIFKDIDRRPWWKFMVNYIQDTVFTRSRVFCRHRSEYIDYFQNRGFSTEYFSLMKGYPYAHYLIRAIKN